MIANCQNQVIKYHISMQDSLIHTHTKNTTPSTHRIHLNDEAGTVALGCALARILTPGLTIYLHGDLGAGKTTLTRALLHAAGYVGRVKSPSYTLAEPYHIALAGQTITLIHFDLYRMNSPEEFLDAGFREDFNAQTICIVEWPEKADTVLPSPDIEIFLTISEPHPDCDYHNRDVKLIASSEHGSSCLASLHNLVPFAPDI